MFTSRLSLARAVSAAFVVAGAAGVFLPAAAGTVSLTNASPVFANTVFINKTYDILTETTPLAGQFLNTVYSYSAPVEQVSVPKGSMVALTGISQLTAYTIAYNADQDLFVFTEVLSAGTDPLKCTSWNPATPSAGPVGCTGGLSLTLNGGVTYNVTETISYKTDPPVGVPEPAAIALLSVGLASLSMFRRRT